MFSFGNVNFEKFQFRGNVFVRELACTKCGKWKPISPNSTAVLTYPKCSHKKEIVEIALHYDENPEGLPESTAADRAYIAATYGII